MTDVSESCRLVWAVFTPLYMRGSRLLPAIVWEDINGCGFPFLSLPLSLLSTSSFNSCLLYPSPFYYLFSLFWHPEFSFFSISPLATSVLAESTGHTNKIFKCVLLVSETRLICLLSLHSS